MTEPTSCRIVLAGRWAADEVVGVTSPCTFDPPQHVRALMDRAWEEAKTRVGIKLFDGPMCRLERFDASPAALTLHLSEVGYKAFLGTNQCNPSACAQIGPHALASPLGLSAAILTTDGQTLLGLRSHRLAYYPGRWHPIAGSLEPTELIRPADGLNREVIEELGLSETDFSITSCLGILEDPQLLHPEMVFEVRLSMSAAELAKRLSEADEEHSTFRFIQAEPVDLLKAASDPALTPVASGTLRLLAGAC